MPGSEVFPLACMMLTIAARFEAPLNHQKVTGLYLYPRFFWWIEGTFNKIDRCQGFCWSKSFCVYSLIILYPVFWSPTWDGTWWNRMNYDTTRVQKWVKFSCDLSGGTVYSVSSRYHITDTSPNLFTSSTIPFLRWRIPLPDPRDRAKIKSEICWHFCSFIPSQDANIIDIIVDIHTSFYRL